MNFEQQVKELLKTRSLDMCHIEMVQKILETDNVPEEVWFVLQAAIK